MAVPAYEVREVTKVYRGAATAANDRISLDIERGTVFAVLGPNGAGKTTLVRQLTGLLRPTSGSIRLFGEDIEARPQVVPNAVAYFGQRVLALHAHRFEEVLRITGMLCGQSPQQARVQAQALMDRFEAARLSRTLLVHLSGGERRLAALLAAFMGDRQLLVLDEPTNDLDPLRRHLLWEYLHERNSLDGTTIVVVSHNLPEVETVARQAILIDQGHVAASGTLGDLKKAVADEVRIELRLRREEPVTAAILSAVPGARNPRPGLWVIATRPEKAPDLLHEILAEVDRHAVDDFRLVTPSLDDV